MFNNVAVLEDFFLHTYNFTVDEYDIGLLKIRGKMCIIEFLMIIAIVDFFLLLPI